MRKIKIKRNTCGDTRTAKSVPSFGKFEKSNTLHRNDVRDMMEAFGLDVREAGVHHDFTKWVEPYGSLFYRELCATIEGKMDFEKGEWYKTHCEVERHHLNRHVPEDVNLIDVIEMICDCVCAGMARSGNVYPIEIPSEVLQAAVKNTVQMCIDAVEIEEGENA